MVKEMKRVRFSYDMKIFFEQPVNSHHFTLRVIPADNERQHIDNINVFISHVGQYQQAIDGLGNTICYGKIEQEHRLFEVHVDGNAMIDEALYESARPSHCLGMYRVQSEYTRPDQRMLEAMSEVKHQYSFFHRGKEGWNTLNCMDKAEHMMQYIHNRIRYQKGVTSINTTAKEAFDAGAGVCQDYAHVMLSFCRMNQIAARYVVGILEGEGETHAWVEIYHQGKWIGIDPTNGNYVDERYIKISAGRDYKDCMVNRGILYGGGLQQQQIVARLERV